MLLRDEAFSRGELCVAACDVEAVLLPVLLLVCVVVFFLGANFMSFLITCFYIHYILKSDQIIVISPTSQQ